MAARRVCWRAESTDLEFAAWVIFVAESKTYTSDTLVVELVSRFQRCMVGKRQLPAASWDCCPAEN
jgi:hypothetical protein